MDYCKETVYQPMGWKFMQCRNRAQTAAGYCRLHDPEIKAMRDEKKPPTKLERQDAARKELIALLKEKMSEEDSKRAEFLLWKVILG